MEYATYARGYIASDTGMQHAPFRITRLWKRSAGRENRQSCRNVDVFCIPFPLTSISTLPRRPPLQDRVENSSISSRGYSLAEWYFRGSRRMEFSSNIMPHKLTGSIFRLFMHRTTIIALTSRNVYLRKVSEITVSFLNHRYHATKQLNIKGLWWFTH